MASISDLESLSPKSATKLRKAGIRTTDGLLKVAASRSGREKLAERCGLTPDELKAWVTRSDLMRVKGIGAEYADLFDACGVQTVRDLRRRKASPLTAKLAEVNEKKRLVRRLPTEGMVEGWIEDAGRLDLIVQL